MSLYAVMEPVADDYGNRTFTRSGAPTKNLYTADRAARRKSGRVIDLSTYECLSDFTVEPAPEPSLGRAEYRAKRNFAQVFKA